MERTTRKDAERAYTRLAIALGKSTGTGVGRWWLDYNGAYGGFVIEEVVNEGGGVTHPFGDMRRSAREFVDVVNFALRVLEVR